MLEREIDDQCPPKPKDFKFEKTQGGNSILLQQVFWKKAKLRMFLILLLKKWRVINKSILRLKLWGILMVQSRKRGMRNRTNIRSKFSSCNNCSSIRIIAIVVVVAAVTEVWIILPVKLIKFQILTALLGLHSIECCSNLFLPVGYCLGNALLLTGDTWCYFCKGN